MCDTINKLGLVSFIKNEIDFIESFIKYHIDIFDSIYFIDDGSTDGTLEIIQKYSSIHLRQVQNSFNLKGEICSEIIHQMTEDIIIPLDADETIVHDNKNIQITNSQYIRQYLQNLPIDGHKYKVNHIYEYNPDHIGWWGIKHHAKIFFPKKTFLYTDPGFHRGRTSLDSCSSFDNKFYWRQKHNDIVIPTNISYLHYHFKSKEIWLKNTAKKLEQRIGHNWRDPNILREYSGPSIHLKREYLKYIDTGKWHDVHKTLRLDIK